MCFFNLLFLKKPPWGKRKSKGSPRAFLFFPPPQKEVSKGPRGFFKLVRPPGVCWGGAPKTPGFKGPLGVKRLPYPSSKRPPLKIFEAYMQKFWGPWGKPFFRCFKKKPLEILGLGKIFLGFSGGENPPQTGVFGFPRAAIKNFKGKKGIFAPRGGGALFPFFGGKGRKVILGELFGFFGGFRGAIAKKSRGYQRRQKKKEPKPGGRGKTPPPLGQLLNPPKNPFKRPPGPPKRPPKAAPPHFFFPPFGELKGEKFSPGGILKWVQKILKEKKKFPFPFKF